MKIPRSLQVQNVFFRSLRTVYHTGKIAFSLGILTFCSYGNTPSARILSTVSVELAHTHEAKITFRDLESGIRIFPLSQSAGHTHSFEIREDLATLLLAGIPVTVNSTPTNGHLHSVLLQKMEN